jgi:hypothetical protein
MDDDASCELVRVIAGCGWAVHALVFEFSDGKRYGTIQSNGCTAMPLTDASIAERCGTTIDIAPGDAIVRAEGHGLRDCPDYLCWGVSLLMSSGARHDVCSTHEDWKGVPFEFDIAPRVLVELLFEHHAVSARTTQPPEVAVPPAEHATVVAAAGAAGAGLGAGAGAVGMAAPAVAAAAPAAPAAAAAAGQAGGGGGSSSSSSDGED